jgi:hypothetical protein
VVNSPSSITALSPPAASGTVDVTVTTPGGTSPTSNSDEYTYDALPIVTAVSPDAGPTTGDTSVTITGSNFTPAAAVAFGPTFASSVTFDSSTMLTAIAPAASAGTVNVAVISAGGTSNTSVADQYPYAYSLATGALPAGTTLNGASGTVSGTPTAAGSYSYTINVVDQVGGSATTSTVSGTISSQLTVTATPSPDTEYAVGYSQTNVASGGSGTYTYSVASGALPSGLILDTTTGTVWGTPTSNGTFSYTITVVDQNGGSATTSTISGYIAVNPLLEA